MVGNYAEDIRRSYHDPRCGVGVFCRGKVNFIYKTLSATSCVYLGNREVLSPLDLSI